MNDTKNDGTNKAKKKIHENTKILTNNDDGNKNKPEIENMRKTVWRKTIFVYLKN